MAVGEVRYGWVRCGWWAAGKGLDVERGAQVSWRPMGILSCGLLSPHLPLRPPPLHTISASRFPQQSSSPTQTSFRTAPPSCEIFRLPLPTSASLLLLQTSPTCPLPRKALWDQSTATRLSGVALIASHTQPASSPSTTSPRDLGTGFLSTVCSPFQTVSYRRAGMAAAIP